MSPQVFDSSKVRKPLNFTFRLLPLSSGLTPIFIMAAPAPEYLWIAVIGGIFGFFYGFLIGEHSDSHSCAEGRGAAQMRRNQ